MSYVTYKQYDSRWGKKNYNGSSSMATAGCGPSSVANLVYPINHSVTPWTVAKYMKNHGYAVYNQGTDWNGIPAAMKKFGMEGVKDVNVDSSMTKVWEYLSKGYTAVFLFRAGSRGGICWTTSGHFVAVTGYRVKDGKHYLYTRDSGGRDHDGWFCYETQMRGLIRKVWVGKVSSKKTPEVPTAKYTGTLPTLPSRGYFKSWDKGAQVKRLQAFLNYAVSAKLAVDGIYGGNTMDAVDTFERQQGLAEDSKFGKKCLSKAKAMTEVKKKKTKADVILDKAIELSYKADTPKKTYAFSGGAPKAAYKAALDRIFPGHGKWKKEIRTGASCSVFVATVMRSCGVDKTMMCDDPCKVYDYLVKSDKWEKVNSGIKPTTLKPGDIICYHKPGDRGHICIVRSTGYIAEANYGRYYPHRTKTPKAYTNEAYIKNTYKRFGVFRIKE